MADAQPWWTKPMVILAHATEYVPKMETNPAALRREVAWKRKAGFTAEHLLLNHSMFAGRGGEDAKAYLFRNFHGYREDWLGRYLPVAQRQGLRVIVYFNCHWFKPDTFPADWYVMDSAGKPKTIYGDGGEVCCRGPFRAWSEKMAGDLGRYPVDGVFLDGPVKDACWCPHCRAAYEAAHGVPLPPTSAACPPDRLAAYNAFITGMAVGYYEAFARGLRKHNPEAILYGNGGNSRQMKESLPWTQWVGEEGGFIGYGPLSGEFPFRAGLAAKELEARARGRARVVFCDSGYKVYDYHVHPRGEIARAYAGTLANGANAWYLVYRPADRTPGNQAVYRFNRLIADHRESLANGESLAEAAILKSPLNEMLAGAATAASGDDVHRQEGAGARLAVPRHNVEFTGLYAALTRSGYPFDLVEDDHLLEGLPKRTRLLVLPGVSAVSDAAAEQIRRFVADGGRVLATFDTSLFDEQGRRRADYALADVFGASAGAAAPLGPSGLDYIGFQKGNALTRDIAQAVLPCPDYAHVVAAARSAKPLLFYHDRMARRYAALPPLSDRPAAVWNRFGKGQALLVPSTIGDLSRRYRFPDIRLLLRNAAQWLALPPVTVEGGDEFVETTLRRGADGSVVLHLINWATGERPSSGAIPLGPLRVTVRLPRGMAVPDRVELGMAGKTVPAETRTRTASFTVPRLGEYELAVLR